MTPATGSVMAPSAFAPHQVLDTMTSLIRNTTVHRIINAGLAVLVGSRENGLKARGPLEQLGFRIEGGERCKAGLVLSACRQDYTQIERAA